MLLELNNLLKNGSKDEINNLMSFKEIFENLDLKLDSKELIDLINKTTQKIEALSLEIETVRFNQTFVTVLDAELQRLDKTLSSTDNVEFLEKTDESAKNVISAIMENVQKYSDHVKYAVSLFIKYLIDLQVLNDVSSCAPIVNILKNTKITACDYTLDAFV